MLDTFDFLKNKYTKWYFNIVSAAQNRNISGYTEEHHIIPKSLGGNNKKENLVNLTGREHFVCHWLLTKMVVGSDKHKMLTAVYRMMVQRGDNQQRIVPTSRIYESIRTAWATEHSNWLTGRFVGEKNPNFGNKMSNESKELISFKKTGHKLGPMPVEQKEKIRVAQLGIPKNNSIAIKKSWEVSRDNRIGENHPMHGKTHSDETKERMKLASANRWTPEARAKASAKKKEFNKLKELKNASSESL